ncbi:MAG: YEATS-associated helix-containing protein [Ginsengibacter sp.]
MSFGILLTIMLLCGIVGGFINFLLPANNNDETGKFVKPWWHCVTLGIGATLLIPLFLEIAQSKLMENIRFDWSWEKPAQIDSGNYKLSRIDTVRITNTVDSSQEKIIKADTVNLKQPKSNQNQSANNASGNDSTGKNYLLFSAYCLLAAAAGFKFINMLINNVVKEKELNEKNDKIGNLEKEQEKRTMNAQISQKQEEQKIRNTIATESIKDIKAGILENRSTLIEAFPLIIPVLPPVINSDDPQKGRFGGESEKNGRKLSAKVSKSAIPKFYSVELIVESTKENNPLITDVIFYLHDSFSPSVYTIKPDEFTEGRAYDNEIISYGAFTVGVITDNGKTLLELDLAEDKKFPKEFRER